MKLGLITNGLSCLQREKIAGSGLAPYFDAMVVAGDVGVAKPHPRVFRRLLDGLRVASDRAVMVGNSVWIVIGNACHGLAYTFFFTSMYITIDSYCDKGSRTGLHQLFTIATAGLGALVANLAGGACLDLFVRIPPVPNYRAFWLVPAVTSGICFILIALWFRKHDDADSIQEIPRTGE